MTGTDTELFINSTDALRRALTAYAERAAIGLYEYRAPQKKREKYAVWGATGIDAPFWSDDGSECFKVRGELWYYSIDAFDPAVTDILCLLHAGGADAAAREIGYDDDLAQVVAVIDWSFTHGES